MDSRLLQMAKAWRVANATSGRPRPEAQGKPRHRLRKRSPADQSHVRPSPPAPPLPSPLIPMPETSISNPIMNMDLQQVRFLHLILSYY